jgi:hypothetical protein
MIQSNPTRPWPHAPRPQSPTNPYR